MPPILHKGGWPSPFRRGRPDRGHALEIQPERAGRDNWRSIRTVSKSLQLLFRPPRTRYISRDAPAHPGNSHDVRARAQKLSLDDILSIDAIDVVQWVSGAGQKPMWQWTEVLQKIQAAGKGVQVWDITCEEVKQVHKELKPEGVVYCTQDMQSPDEVDDLCQWLEKNT